MNTTEFLQDLRRAQRRAAQEQQILSGQDFILMAGWFSSSARSIRFSSS
jgi:hypothetical protein